MNIFLVDIDGTFADAPHRLKQVVSNYVPEKQLTYSIEPHVLSQFEHPSFYSDDLNTIDSVINYLNNNTENKSPTKIVFLSKCLNEEVANAKIEYVKRNLFKLKAKQYSLENIISGDPSLKEILKVVKAENLNKEYHIHCLDDNPSRLLEYISLKKEYTNIKIVPIAHPYNIEFTEVYKNEIEKPLQWK